jgi:hypothetical protein
VAEAARVYLERTKASVDTVNRATEIRLLAERQMGEFLKAMPKAHGGAHYRTDGGRGAAPTGNSGKPVVTLSEIGVTKMESSRAQKLADIPADEFQARIAVAKIDGKLTRAAVVRTNRVRTIFVFDAWKRQARSVMTTCD